MTDKKKFIIGSRGSKLSLAYSNHVKNLLIRSNSQFDNNSIEILKMLLENDQITSNDIVAKLVENGLSYDYASKVKNKIIESLNEKFEFITNSNAPFINISKSSQDKRIQILSLLKN